MRERILARIVVTDTGCWDWTGYREPAGYGRIKIGGRKGRVLYAHRVSYEAFVGPIPDGLTIDHLCRNRACVNPAHLEPVTQRTNTLRSPASPAAVNARKTHCPAGHPLDGQRRDDGRPVRYCLTCDRRRRRVTTPG